MKNNNYMDLFHSAGSFASVLGLVIVIFQKSNSTLAPLDIFEFILFTATVLGIVVSWILGFKFFQYLANGICNEMFHNEGLMKYFGPLAGCFWVAFGGMLGYMASLLAYKIFIEQGFSSL